MVWYPRSSALLAPFAFIGAFAAEFGGSFEATSPAHGSPACAPPALQYVISRPPGSRAMRRAVRLALQRFRAAEKEVRMAGIADRPAAGASSQFDERAALPVQGDGVRWRAPRRSSANRSMSVFLNA